MITCPQETEEERIERELTAQLWGRLKQSVRVRSTVDRPDPSMSLAQWLEWLRDQSKKRYWKNF